MWTTETVDLNGPDRRRAGQFVQSGRTSFFPVPVLRTSTTGRTVTFFPELNEPARPMAAGPVSCRGGPGERGADRATRRSGGNPAGLAATMGLPGLDHGGS